MHGIDLEQLMLLLPPLVLQGLKVLMFLTRARANGLNYSVSAEGIYGKANASFTKEQTEAVGGTWVENKVDSRDLLGGVVTVKSTFANFLDVWPEYSVAKFVTSNVVEVYNAMPYRVGDNVKRQRGTASRAQFSLLKKTDFCSFQIA